MSGQASTSAAGAADAARRSGSSADETKTHFRVCRFIIENGVKLGMKPVPMATACILYHKFFQSASLKVYEPYLVAMSAIYLAGKVEEQHLRTRDIINVCHRHLHPKSEPMELEGKFWEYKESIVQCELLLLRHLGFRVSFDHPHKYLLHYLLSVKGLMNRHAWCRTPITETALAILKDSYHGAVCIAHKPQHMALACLYIALQTYGVALPAGDVEWWQVFCTDITKHKIDAIASDILRLYDLEAKCA